MSLLCSRLKPVPGIGGGLFYANAIGIAYTQRILPVGISVFGGLPKPVGGDSIILFHAVSVKI